MCKGSEKARTSLLMGEDFSICFLPFSHFVNPPLCFALTFHCVNVVLTIRHPSLPPEAPFPSNITSMKNKPPFSFFNYY
jgi:hypothetical protein